MPIIYRSIKGSELTSDEVDNNFSFLDSTKQDNLTFDSIPTDGSSNPVTSDGIYTAISSIDLSAYLKKDGSVAMTGNLNFGGNQATNIYQLTNASGNNTVRVLLDPTQLGLRTLNTNTGVGSTIDLTNEVQIELLGATNHYVKLSSSGFGIKTNAGGFVGNLNTDALTADRDIPFQDKEYTGVADLSDIPSLSGYLKSDGSVALSAAWYNSQNASFSNLGIGTGSTSPSSKLHIVETSTSSPRGLLSDQYNSGTNSSQVNLRKARGVFGTPTVITTGDILSNINSWGHDGTNFIQSGSIMVSSVGTIGTGRVPSKMEFRTSTDATTSVLTTALTLTETQKATFANNVELSSLSVLDTTYKSAIDVQSANNLRVGNGFTTVSIAGNTLNAPGTISRSGSITVMTGGDFTVQPPSGQGFVVSKNTNTSSGDLYYVKVQGTISGVSTANYVGVNVINTINSPTSGYISLFEANPTITSVSNVIYGYRSRLNASPTGGGTAWNIYADGTAGNYFGGDVMLEATKAVYLGNSTTNGTWRIIRSGNDLVFERREAGVYVNKWTISA